MANSGYLPICLQVRKKPCLLVGGGRVALRKIAVLRKFGAHVTCLSPEFLKPIQLMGNRRKIKCIKQRYSAKMSLRKYALVIAATDDPRINIRVARNAMRDKIPVNVVDDSIAGTMIMPAIFKRKGLLVSVSTGGVSPSQAKKVRDIIRDAL